MQSPPLRSGHADTGVASFYRHVLKALDQAAIPFLVGGAYALGHYAGIYRDTKDLDIFVLPEDSVRALQVFAEAGYRTERTFAHWLGKVFGAHGFIDIIHSSGNGICQVDEGWFANSLEGEVLGLPVRFCPIEESIWSKGFVMERERYDGADIAHLLRACGKDLDWRRLIDRFGNYWRILLNHLILFGFIYPGERSQIPAWVMDELLRRLREESWERVVVPPLERQNDRICRGTILSREQYLVDVERWGYRDARLGPGGSMLEEEVAQWTAAIEQKND